MKKTAVPSILIAVMLLAVALIAEAQQSVGVKLAVLNAREPSEIDNAFLTMANEGLNALIVIPDYRYVQHAERILKHAEKSRLSAVYPLSIFVENERIKAKG